MNVDSSSCGTPTIRLEKLKAPVERHLTNNLNKRRFFFAIEPTTRFIAICPEDIVLTALYL